MDNVVAIDILMGDGDTKPQILDIRKDSTGNLDIHIIKTKPIPNYLKPSKGSCHDYCKYGMSRDDFQKKQIRRGSLKTAKTSLAVSSKNLGNVRTKSEILKRPLKTAKSETKNMEKKVLMRTKSLVKHTARPITRTQSLGSATKHNIEFKPSCSKTRSSRNLSISKNVTGKKKTCNCDNVPEKTLYVVEAEDGSRSIYQFVQA